MSDAVFKYDFTPHKTLLSNLKIGIVTAMWNSDVTSELYRGALDTLISLGVSNKNVIELQVAGAFELPLGASQLIHKSHCDGVIALGCVIKGDTPHFDYVCDGATQGIMTLMLATQKPIGFGLITTLNHQQALERTGGIHGHKGREAAETVLQQLIEYQNL